MSNLVERTRSVAYFPLFLAFFWKKSKIQWFLNFFLGNLTKNVIVFLCFFLVSINFFSFFSIWIYDLVIFFVKYNRMIVILDVFSTFYWFWKKVVKMFTFLKFFFEFFEFFLEFWQKTKNLIVFLRLFLVSVTFFSIFSLCFYDIVIFFIQDGRTIMVLSVFPTFYCIWKKVWHFW